MDDTNLTPPSEEGGLLNEVEQTLQAAANAAENLVGKITMVAVGSSDIAAWGYDPVRFTLQIQFTNGRIHAYSNVSPLDFEEAVLAPSKGKWFWSRIRRNPIQYPWTRIQ